MYLIPEEKAEKTMEKISRSSSSILLSGLLILLLISNFHGVVQLAEAGQRRIEITDDLDDVEDNEEDDSWKEWGNKAPTPEFDPPPDFSNMGFEQIQAEMAKRTFGPVVGFVKLRLGVLRTKVTINIKTSFSDCNGSINWKSYRSCS